MKKDGITCHCIVQRYKYDASFILHHNGIIQPDPVHCTPPRTSDGAFITRWTLVWRAYFMRGYTVTGPSSYPYTVNHSRGYNLVLDISLFMMETITEKSTCQEVCEALVREGMSDDTCRVIGGEFILYLLNSLYIWRWQCTDCSY